MKTLRGVVVAAVLLAVGLLGASAALAVGTLTVDPNPNDCPPNYTELCVYFGESGTPVTRTITLSNDHLTDAVTVENIQLVRYDFDDPTEVDNFHFSVDGDPGFPFDIAALGSVDVDVTWTPSTQPRDRAILRITHNAGDPIDVDLGGGKPYFFEPPGLGAGASALDLGNVNIGQPAATGNQVGFNSHDRIRVRHSGPAFPNVTVNGCPTKSPDDPVFRVRCTHTVPEPLLTTQAPRLVYRTGFHPTTTGSKSTTVTFELTTPAGTEFVDIDVSGTGVGGPALYRVNSGGPIVDVNATSQSFTRDEVGNPSAYFIHGDGTAGSTGAAVNTSDPSIPDVPDAIFSRYRLRGNAGAPIVYQFPVDPDLYTVRLFFAETVLNGPGQRVIDVSINGSIVIPDLDPYQVAGGKNIAFARAFLVDEDNLIEVKLESPGAIPPILSAVEIITGGTAELDDPNDVAFGSVAVQSTATKKLTITNSAGSSGVAVRIDSVDLSAGAGDYEISGLPAWVAPDDDLELEVAFKPSQTGARPATATFQVDGGDDLQVNLTGNGVNTRPVAMNDAYQTDQDAPLVVGSPGVLGNDTDSNGDPLTVVPGAAPANGSLDLNANGGFTYTPDAGFVGTDSFTYRARDGLANSNLATVTITVNEVEGDEDPDDEEPDDVSFVDIDGSTFTQDILWLARVGITRGCNPPVNDRFCPDDFVTRGQMAAFFVRGLDLTDRLDDPFVDDDGDTFEADIERLAAADVTRGCNPPVNDRFCPDDFVTRGQMAAFFVRGLDLTDRLDDPFVDDDGDTFEADIERLAAADITRGCNPPSNDRFCPDDFVTRGQMAAFFHRAAELLGLPG